MSATHTGSANSRNIVWVIGVGASRGTGAAVARRFAREGFTVAVTGRSAENLQAVADEIKAEGGHAIEAVGDAQDEAGVLEILRRLETIGPVEIGLDPASVAFEILAGESCQRQLFQAAADGMLGIERCRGGHDHGRRPKRVAQQHGQDRRDSVIQRNVENDHATARTFEAADQVRFATLNVSSLIRGGASMACHVIKNASRSTTSLIAARIASALLIWQASPVEIGWSIGTSPVSM